MTMTTWPLVDKNDDGIRPAGKPDACFYCQQTVGSPHGADCVVVKRRIEMLVRVTLDGGQTFRGTWQVDEPHSFDADTLEFFRNDSTWCAANFLEEREAGTVTWDDGDPWDELEAANEDGDCLCSRLSFTFLRVVDDTPRREIRQPAS